MNIFETEQLQIGKLGRDKTKLSCLVANCVHTVDTDKTGQDSFGLSVSAVWTSY